MGITGILNRLSSPEILVKYTDSRVGSGVYSGKLVLNISLRLPDYCSVFQAKVMAIYRTAQWILINGASFTSISVFSDSQAAIGSLSALALTKFTLFTDFGGT